MPPPRLSPSFPQLPKPRGPSRVPGHPLGAFPGGFPGDFPPFLRSCYNEGGGGAVHLPTPPCPCSCWGAAPRPSPPSPSARASGSGAGGEKQGERGWARGTAVVPYPFSYGGGHRIRPHLPVLGGERPAPVGPHVPVPVQGTPGDEEENGGGRCWGTRWPPPQNPTGGLGPPPSPPPFQLLPEPRFLEALHVVLQLGAVQDQALRGVFGEAHQQPPCGTKHPDGCDHP